MNDKKTITKAEDILTISFSPALKGYNPREVDLALDSIYDFIRDVYKSIRILEDAKGELQNRLHVSQQRVIDLEVENAALRKRIEAAVVDSDSTTNIDYLKRIRELEMVLYNHGIDPKRIK